MKKYILAVSLFLAVILNCSNALAFVHIEGRYWFTDLSNVAIASTGGVTGTDLNFNKDLDLEKRKDFWEARVSLELDDHQIRYGFLPLKWSGTRNLAGSISFNGQTFTGQTDSTLKADYHRLGYKYDFVDLLGSDLGVIIEFKYFNATIGVKSPAGPAESRGIDAFFPTLGVSGHLGLPFKMNFGGEVTGVMLTSKLYTADGELALNINTIPFVTISGGYRALIVYIEKQKVKEDMTLVGPFLLLRAGF
jgi:hypothetical protein